MKKIVVIDNYDSFTYNLVHYLEDLNCIVTVYRNDEIEIEMLEHFDKILLSPGPGIPDEAGLLKQIIKTYSKTKSILGICLGHQAICEVFGGKIINLNQVYHGISTEIEILASDEQLFSGLNSKINVGRYHSWIVSKNNLPEDIEITSIDNDNQIMSIRHKTYDVKGVQFHPESILTPNGKRILKNWIEL
jgi:anthranilate synthase component 2